MVVLLRFLNGAFVCKCPRKNYTSGSSLCKDTPGDVMDYIDN